MMIKNTERHYRISESSPENFTISPIKASDIFEATRNFLYENFRGAIDIESELYSDGYVSISPDGLAYFFKLLLNAIFGESLVFIKMSTKDDIFSIEAYWNRHRNITANEISELENIARVSGLALELVFGEKKCHANITMQIKKETLLRLYAVSAQKMHEAYIRVFFL